MILEVRNELFAFSENHKTDSGDTMKVNLKWVLIGLLAFLFLCAAISAAFVFLMKMMKGAPYELSLQIVREHPAVIQQVGPSIEPSWYVLGSVSTSGPDGSAALQYLVSGELSKADVYAYATKHAGEWNLDELIVVPKNESAKITIVSDD